VSTADDRDEKPSEKPARGLHRGIVDRQVELYRGLAGVGTVGLEIAIAIALGYLLGQWADTRWGTAPIFLCAGLGLGVIVAVKAVVRVMRLLRKEAEREEREQGNPKPLYESTAERDERKKKGERIEEDPIVDRLPFEGDELRKKGKKKSATKKAPDADAAPDSDPNPTEKP
jgi:ATP synthase protein I